MLLIMTKKMKAKRKPLSFSTTMRNPGRMAGFLNQMKPYENQILTSEIIYKIISGVIKNKLYKTNYEIRNPKYKQIFYSEELEFNDKQVDDIIKNSTQKHKEAGYEYGWESRFQTWYSLSQEFGFVFYNKGEKILISESGQMLIDAYNEKTPNEEKIRNVFLNAMVKYQTNNPFKKNSNSNIPLVLLLKVLKLLKADTEENNAGIFRNELSLFICWNDEDADKLYNKVKEIRKDVGYNYSNEYMYNICLEILGYTTDEEKNSVKKYFKMKKICGESVDEYIRKMRSTGIISLRGNGRFIDINSFESKKIEYILKSYDKPLNFESKKAYYDYIGKIDRNFISIENYVTHDVEYNTKINTLYDFAKKYTKEEILNELLFLASKKESKNPTFKFIPEPTRLEFLTSVSLAQNLQGCIVEPNYSIDDEGLPTMTARGNMPDIVCKDPEKFITSNIEVTLMRDRSNQINNEIIPIRRHLLSIENKNDIAFAIFIAPCIHEDTKESAAWYKYKDNVDIYTYSIKEYTNKIRNIKYLIELSQVE